MISVLRSRQVFAVLTMCNWLIALCAAPVLGQVDHGRTIGQPHRHVEPDEARFFSDRTGNALVLPAEDDAFSFVVFGDRTGGPADGVKVLAQAVRDANLIEPDLVMTVGDLIEGYNDTPLWLEQMQEFKGIMNGLLMPWFPVAGNHDIYWRGQGPKPEGEHESNYESHFGPLWYAFAHKNCYFIALYSDEGHPDTGMKGFSQPDRQRMSDEQIAFLEEALRRGGDADHVFVFLHHPRWLGGRYGDDWNRVHKVLADAGNVSAVFAGHIHKMRYDGRRDGIEYITLATVGGGQSGAAPSAGFLHQFHLVTVREKQIALASIPVGGVTDVRKLTGDVSMNAEILARMRPQIQTETRLDSSGALSGEVTVIVTNPIGSRIEVAMSPSSEDSRWSFSPDHQHGTLDAGGSAEFAFHMQRVGGRLDDTFRPAEIVLDCDLLTDDRRYAMPRSVTAVPVRADLAPPAVPEWEMTAEFNGSNAAIVIPSDEVALPDGPMTLECWFNGDAFGGRRGLVGKTENSEYGFFVTDGKPAFYLFLSGAYVEVISDEALLNENTWHHVAGVFDGAQTRLYLDGVLIASADKAGVRRTNGLPLIIGADVDGNGNPTSYFDGRIDAVRLSTVARYSGDQFTPMRRPLADADTLVLYNMDAKIGPWLFDESANGVHAIPRRSVMLRKE